MSKKRLKKKGVNKRKVTKSRLLFYGMVKKRSLSINQRNSLIILGVDKKSHWILYSQNLIAE